eukprot:TRINITY_DN38211_c0_g1_i1.p1 TRINITY_DN38211_c0_g1~~TRINITY_DN38211_c0_g1_i1.p1  ORF type:complete len:796 (+),score=105.71 TRINITY_DN38211_c0_g1_i1:236-2623(+)
MSMPMDVPPAPSLRVLTLTWNLGNQRPLEHELELWLPSGGDGLDICAVSLQEAKYKGSRMSFAPNAFKLSSWLRRFSEEDTPFQRGFPPMCVNPCGVLPVVDVEMGTYKMPLEGAVPQLVDAGIVCGGTVSHLCSMSADSVFTQRCASSSLRTPLPKAPMSLVWAYASESTRDICPSSPCFSQIQTLQSHSECSLILFGGVLFLDSGGKCVAACSFSSGNELIFEGPYDVNAEVSGALVKRVQDSNRFQPVVSASLRKEGALRYSWILPGEDIGGDQCCVDGGFLFEVEEASRESRFVYFRIRVDDQEVPIAKKDTSSGEVMNLTPFWLEVGDSSSDDEDHDEESQHQFGRMIGERLGGEWREVKEVHLMEIWLCVFARRQLDIVNVEKAWSATGVAHVVGNKGGVVVSFDVCNTSFCFVGCHLAAHHEFTKRRKADCEQILRQARVRDKNLDVASQFDYCFWMGDLNYRIDLEGNDGEDRPEDCEKVYALIAAERWQELLSYDQLRREQELGEIFVGFEEGNPEFPPTFKVCRRSGVEYEQKRVPSYCDRILWKCLPHCQASIQQTSLKAIVDVSTSDHKPVCAWFKICPSQDRHADHILSAELMDQAISLYVTSVKCDFLGEVADTNHAYIEFRSIPPALFSANSKLRSSTLMRTKNPRWDSVDLPVLRACVKAEFLPFCTLVLQFYDHEIIGTDEPLGIALLSLAPQHLHLRDMQPSKLLRDSSGRSTESSIRSHCDHRYEINFNIPVVLRNARKGEVRGQLVIFPGMADNFRMNAERVLLRKNPDKCCVVA